MNGATYFTTLNLRAGYHHIPLDKPSILKTAFKSPFRKYEYVKVPFGLAQAPAYFQELITGILKDFNFVKAYLDNITIFSKTPQEHLSHIRKVFEKLRSAKLSMKISKCNFFSKEIQITKANNTNNKVNRWSLELATYNITFEWISGAKNKAIDCLSWLVELLATTPTTVNMLTVTHTDGPAFNTRSHTKQNSPDTTPTPNLAVSAKFFQKQLQHPNPLQQTDWRHYCKCRGLTSSVNIFLNIC